MKNCHDAIRITKLRAPRSWTEITSGIAKLQVFERDEQKGKRNA